MIILGIDPGLADTGFGVIEKTQKGDLEALDYGNIQTKAGHDFPSRLEKIGQDLGDIIDRYRPDIIGVEQLFFCKNVKTALAVGHARGVVLYIAKQKKKKVLEFTPLQIKQAVTSYGGAQKMQVQKMVKILLGLKELPRPDDAADALAVAICASS